jgi:hypothetical protein
MRVPDSPSRAAHPGQQRFSWIARHSHSPCDRHRASGGLPTLQPATLLVRLNAKGPRRRMASACIGSSPRWFPLGRHTQVHAPLMQVADLPVADAGTVLRLLWGRRREEADDVVGVGLVHQLTASLTPPLTTMLGGNGVAVE